MSDATRLADAVQLKVSYVYAATGPSIWDDPFADEVVRRFMPLERKHKPMVGVIDLHAVRPTPGVLQRVVVGPGEDVKAGKYGNCSLIFCSQDEDTRSVICDIAESQNVAMFLCSTFEDIGCAEPVGDLTSRDSETLEFVIEAGGTVSASGFADQVGIERTAAGNRLVSLQKKGYVLRAKRPHPVGDLFIDPRSLTTSNSEAEIGRVHREVSPNRVTREAIEAARRGEVEEIGSSADLIDALNRDE